MTSHRTERVADLLRRELSEILRTEVKDPRVHLATVAHVNVSRDLRHARVGVSILGEDSERDAVLQAIRHAAGFIRHQLSNRIRLRAVPELRFELDRGAEHSLRISQLLDSMDDGRDPSP